MRVRTFAFAALAGSAFAGLVSLGTASAATPFVIPDAATVGVELTPGETQSLASGPLPALVDRFVPSSSVTVGVMPDSRLPQDDKYVYADVNSIVGEAASRPGGSVDVLIDSEGLAVLQYW